MKRLLFSVLAFIMIVSNVGCKKISSDVTAVTSGLSFTAEISSSGEKIVCETKIDKDTSTEITVVAPDKIKGLRFVYKNGESRAEYKGLVYNFSSGNNPQCDTDILYQIFQNAEKNKNQVTKKDDTYLIENRIDGYEYSLYLGSTGLPIKILCNNSISIIIKNATII